MIVGFGVNTPEKSKAIAEVADGDSPGLERISFEFNRRHFGRLRQLINKLNRL